MSACHEKTRTLLKKSADVQYYKGHLIMMGAMVVGFTLLAALCAVATDERVFWIVALPGAFIGLPLVVWYVLNLVHIFRAAEHYRFYDPALTHPQSTWGRRLLFTVTVEGKTLETRAMFNTYGLLSPQFNDYVDQTVLVGYNAETEELVVVLQA